MELDSRGYQIMTHALRADSVHMILDTYERLEQAHGARDRRLRIEHADLVEAVDVPRFAKLWVIADMQPTFCCGEDGGNYDPADEVPSDRWHRWSRAAPCSPSAATGPAPGRPALRIDSGDGDPAGLEIRGHGQRHGRPIGWSGPGRRPPHRRKSTFPRSGSPWPMPCAPTLKARLTPPFPTESVGTLEVGKLADLAVSVAGYFLGAARDHRQDARAHDHGGREDRVPCGALEATDGAAAIHLLSSRPPRARHRASHRHRARLAAVSAIVTGSQRARHRASRARSRGNTRRALPSNIL